MTNNTNPTVDAIQAQMRSLAIRIQMVTEMVKQDAANIVASASALQRDIEAGFVRADNGGFVSAHLNSYQRNAAELEALGNQMTVLLHIVTTTTGVE